MQLSDVELLRREVHVRRQVQRLSAGTVGCWCRRTMRDAGPSGFVLHGPRHFWTSGLIAAGCDVVTVQRALGH